MKRHDYVSTACYHGHCIRCRNTCKYCDAPCAHDCHPGERAETPEPWVDQARAVATELLSLNPVLPDGLRERITTDPDLFWLRGEVKPNGTWREKECDGEAVPGLVNSPEPDVPSASSQNTEAMPAGIA